MIDTLAKMSVSQERVKAWIAKNNSLKAFRADKLPARNLKIETEKDKFKKPE